MAVAQLAPKQSYLSSKDEGATLAGSPGRTIIYQTASYKQYIKPLPTTNLIGTIADNPGQALNRAFGTCREDYKFEQRLGRHHGVVNCVPLIYPL
jgi:hypothetical protein